MDYILYGHFIRRYIILYIGTRIYYVRYSLWVFVLMKVKELYATSCYVSFELYFIGNKLKKERRNSCFDTFKLLFHIFVLFVLLQF